MTLPQHIYHQFHGDLNFNDMSMSQCLIKAKNQFAISFLLALVSNCALDCIFNVLSDATMEPSPYLRKNEGLSVQIQNTTYAYSIQ